MIGAMFCLGMVLVVFFSKVREKHLFLLLRELSDSEQDNDGRPDKFCPHCFKGLDKQVVICPRCYRFVVRECPNCGEITYPRSNPEETYFYCEKCGIKFPLQELQKT